MTDSSNFFTLKGYQQNLSNQLTPALEDYLEMIYRLLLCSPVVRIGDLARNLNVKPSSSTKMVQLLKNKDLVQYQQYGYISLTPQGQELSLYLYNRHNLLHEFFCTVNHSKNELELVEMVEHFIDKTTLDNLEVLTRYLQEKKY